MEKNATKLTEIKKPTFKTSAAWVSKMAMLTAISFLLYFLGRFVKIPGFPSFLDFQISELPALLAGFSMGPVSGCLVIVFKCLLKLPLSQTAFVGELTDIILGMSFVLPASLWYKLSKHKRSALYAMIFSSVFASFVAVIINRYISVPFYATMFGGMDNIVGMMTSLYPSLSMDNFWNWYLWAGILPFNIVRYAVTSAITFIVYKRLSRILHWEGGSLRKKNATIDADQIDFEDGVNGEVVTASVEDTYELAQKVADTLVGGEIIILDGDLGAGKTTFTKGLAIALGVKEELTSPTFTIMNVYEDGRLKLNHLDMYRIENEEDLYELGIEEDALDSNGVTVIEWNKYKDLTGRVITVKISVEGETRRKFEFSESKK